MNAQADLEQRIEALERALAEMAADQLQPNPGPGADQLQQNLLVVNPDGTVGANFTGHVHAQGLDLDAGSSPTPPSSDRVRWIRTSDNAVVADLIANFEGSGLAGNTLIASAYTHSPPINTDDSFATVMLQTAAPGGQLAYLIVGDSGIGRGVFARGAAIGTNRTIVDDQGRSSFLQNFPAAAKAAQVQYGHLGPVNSDGGGWLNFVLPAAFPTAIDFVAASNDGQGAQFADDFLTTQAFPAGSPQNFRVFVNAAGRNCSCSFFAIGH